MKHLIALLAVMATPALMTPALAAGEEKFLSLRNTEFVVTLAFIAFIAVLIYFGVPRLLAGLLDKRALEIKSDLDEAKALRDEAAALLASYERKQKEVLEQSQRIVATARDEAMAAAEKAREDLKQSIARRVQAAEEQIVSAEAAAVRVVRDRAVTVAIAAASDVIARQMTDESGDALIDSAIAQVEARMH